MEQNETLYIVTQAHHLDYISSTVYLTRAQSPNEAIVNCMGYESPLAEEEEEEEAERARLLALSLHDLEQSERESGTVWHAEKFLLPSFTEDCKVIQIAKLDTD
jgi:hypothetical protein